MTDSAPASPPPATDAAGGPSPLGEIQALLVGPEREAIARLQARLDDPAIRAPETSRDLAEALTLVAADPALGAALGRPAGRALRLWAARDPRRLAAALGPGLLPALGAGLRAAIGREISAVERAVSPRAIFWRLAGLLSGKPFEQVADERDLLWSVEHAVLLDRRSGGPLAVASTARSPRALEGLTALLGQLAPLAAADGPAELSHEPWTVRLERGPRAVVACAFRGQPPDELGRALVESRAAIEGGWRQALDARPAAPGAFAEAEPLLEALLGSCYRSQSIVRSSFLWGALALLLAAAGLWAALWLKAERRFEGYVDRLRSTPGIVVTAADRQGGRYHVSGLRDPSAPDPLTLARQAGLDPLGLRLQFAPFLSLAPDTLAARAAAILEPPPGVQLQVDGNRLKAEGRAPHGWIAEARRLVRSVPGVTQLDEEGLVDADFERLAEKLAAIEALPVEFAPRSSALPAGIESALREQARAIESLAVEADGLKQRLRVTVLGRGDGPGPAELGRGRERAARVLGALVNAGVDPDLLVVRSVPPAGPGPAVTFDVRLEDLP